MKRNIYLSFVAILFAFVGCEKNIVEKETPVTDADIVQPQLKNITSGLTAHFQQWLGQNGYVNYDFLRDDIEGGSFGGKMNDDDLLVNHPVIFIHGNSDKALGDVFGQTGWTASVNYFKSNGYKGAELYGFTWGPANALLSAEQCHSYTYLSQIRAFILAVKQYTGAEKVDIIGHSMGVTLARKAIKGGNCFDEITGTYKNLGSPLTTIVDAFVGIAGANKGLVSCYVIGGATKTCDNTTGLYPGYLFWGMGPYGVSDILVDINSQQKYEGRYIYTIWSTVDEVIGYGCLVYGLLYYQNPRAEW
jgi:triacylglycerol lipase